MNDTVNTETKLKMLEMKYEQLLSRTEMIQRRLQDCENILVQSDLRSQYLTKQLQQTNNG